MIARAGLTHDRPPFGIDSVMVGNEEVAVREEAGARHARSATCCTSRRTSIRSSRACCWWRRCPGHFATLLRGTVRTLLPENDVYITDWHNARDVAAARTAGSASTNTSQHIDRLPGGDRAGRARGRGLPALRRRAWSPPR